ncbi:MAG TPA: hypothetical protein VMT03_26140 [Polyangia bacterium]|nr:hypothetical protein [Polyangia bacterium]
MEFSRWSALLLGVALAGVGCNWNANLGSVGDGSVSLLWKSTFEVGNLSEWTADNLGGTEFSNGISRGPGISSMAHRGNHGAEVIVFPTQGMASVSYLYRLQPTPPAAYYSAFFYVPGTIYVPAGSYLSLCHFRSSTTPNGTGVYAAWDVNLYTQANGSLVAQMYDFKTDMPQSPPVTPFPTDQWVQLEVLLDKAVPTDAGTPTGRVAVWQDGKLILDHQDIATVQSSYLEWDIGGTSINIQPDPISIYVDDAAISLVRLGLDIPF